MMKIAAAVASGSWGEGEMAIEGHFGQDRGCPCVSVYRVDGIIY